MRSVVGIIVVSGLLVVTWSAIFRVAPLDMLAPGAELLGAGKDGYKDVISLRAPCRFVEGGGN